MQNEMLVGLGGLLLLGMVMLRGGAALAMLTYSRVRAQSQERRLHKSLRSLVPVQHGANAVASNRQALSVNVPARSRPPEVPGTMKLVVAKRITENAKGDICSFYLCSAERRALPRSLPGQFLTFNLSLPGMSSPVARCYSLSMYPSHPQEFYRISVKRLGAEFATAGAPPGLLSNYLHDQVPEGTVIEALGPSGNFCLQQSSDRPVVLIGGGIGATPLLSMLDWLAETKSEREVWFFYGVRNSFEHAFQDHIKMIRRTLPNVRVVVFYSRPTTACRRDVDFDAVGHVRVDDIMHLLKTGGYEFYVCGPPSMVHDVTHDLLKWGVPGDAIMSEDFGSGVQSTPVLMPTVDEVRHLPKIITQKISVEFVRSKRKVAWTGRQRTLLELAEACGVNARHSCRAGQCGTCKAVMCSGQVDYISQPASGLESGTCLPCISRPVTDLVLDL
jgi:uncharacterized protein